MIICTSCKSGDRTAVKGKNDGTSKGCAPSTGQPINVHFNQGKHSQLDMCFAVLEKLYNAERTERQLREGLWIKELRTVRPDGYNVKDSFSIILAPQGKSTGMT